MLRVKCPEHLAEVRAWAEANGASAALDEVLAYLGGYACHGDRPQDYTSCYLYRDFSPNSFAFEMHIDYEALPDGTYRRLDQGKPWLHGGAIWHEDEGRWGVHT